MEHQKSTKSCSFCLAFLLAVVFVTSSCEHSIPVPEQDWPPKVVRTKTFYGPATPLGNGVARSRVVVDEQGTPQSIGVKVSERALLSLGDEHEVFTLELPKQAKNMLYDHITLDWNPHGHPAEGVYTLPHFDLHFYMISEEERAEIPFMPPFDENGQLQFDELPAPVFIPEDYRPDPGIVPHMGVHWGDSEAPELNGEIFTQTFIYGSYDGDFIFHEPMFTVAYLEELKEKDDPFESYNIKQPEDYQMNGYYPTEYSFKYEPSPGNYIFSLDKLVLWQ